MRRIGRAVLLMALVAALALTATAHAAFPGENGKIAFVKRVPGTGGYSDIYVVNPDGTGQVNLTADQSDYAQHPAWSADGSKIVYERFDASVSAINGSIWTMNADGSGKTEVIPYPATTPSWSPDGRVVFARVDDCCSYIWIANADGTGQVRVPVSGEALDPWWSPDGSRIAFRDWCVPRFCSEPKLSTVRPDGSDYLMLSGVNADYGGDWSPNGSELLSWEDDFTSDPPGLVRVPADGSGRTYIDGPYGDRAVWSPDGARIALRHIGGIATINPDGTGIQQVTSDTGGIDLTPNWQPLIGPRPADYKNRAEFCRAERDFLGQARFQEKYGRNGNGSNAFGKCVSGK